MLSGERNYWDEAMEKILFSLSVVWVICCQVMGLEADPNPKDPYLSGKVSEQPERRRAYEPFEELEKKRAEEEARLKWKFSKDHVVIRLASKEQLEARIANGAKANEPLEDVAGIKSVSPLFPVKANPIDGGMESGTPSARPVDACGGGEGD
jgi:hypothetical protein